MIPALTITPFPQHSQTDIKHRLSEDAQTRFLNEDSVEHVCKLLTGEVRSTAPRCSPPTWYVSSFCKSRCFSTV